MRCWINLVWPGSPAQVRMGLDVYDYVVGVGEGSQHIEHATYKQFMDYMRSVPSGETTVVEVTNHGKKIIRRGIAP